MSATELLPHIPHGVRRYDHKKIKCRCDVCRAGRRAYDAARDPAANRARAKAHREANPEQYRIQRKVHYLANADAVKEKAAARYHGPLKAKVQEQHRVYAKTPEGRAARRAVDMKRRGAPGHATRQQIEDRIAYFGGCCAYCPAPYEHLDHVKPIADGGSEWPANLRPACADCNLRKGRKSWRLFLNAA